MPLLFPDLQLILALMGQALEGVITKAPLGGEATGPRPVARAKKGTTRRVLTDRRGAPVAVVVTGANTPDKTVALETVASLGVPRPERVG
jgi:putative transposase